MSNSNSNTTSAPSAASGTPSGPTAPPLGPRLNSTGDVKMVWSCEDCFFFDRSTPIPASSKDNDVDKAFHAIAGFCRRGSPGVGTYPIRRAIWPLVAKSDFCAAGVEK
ncbi:hypothetical protein [Sabulicella rubraurantiaca]|uniref:hypothetical protein n=1 Tax=Sabulicella rubraurantiaca TaxID=2811429 RepID=UPI001A979E3B|nr:hypothetical protein [Sabulicella rubraurantiaca]